MLSHKVGKQSCIRVLLEGSGWELVVFASSKWLHIAQPGHLLAEDKKQALLAGLLEGQSARRFCNGNGLHHVATQAALMPRAPLWPALPYCKSSGDQDPLNVGRVMHSIRMVCARQTFSFFFWSAKVCRQKRAVLCTFLRSYSILKKPENVGTSTTHIHNIIWIYSWYHMNISIISYEIIIRHI